MSSNCRINDNELLFASGGFRNLLSFKIARICYDVTFRFAELYIPARSRTADQMVQAARSGVQNIAEGSMAAAASKRTEIKLTNVARASLVELRLDYEDYLRLNGESLWDADNNLRNEFIRRKIASNRMFREFVEFALTQESPSVKVRSCPLKSVIVANAAVLLIDVAVYSLTRQLKFLTSAYKERGGFTEKMYNIRINNRKRKL